MSTTDRPSIFDPIIAAASGHDDERIFEMIDLMEQKPRAERTGDESTVLTALYMVIESRHDVDDEMDAWAADLDSTLTYGQALAKAIGR